MRQGTLFSIKKEEQDICENRHGGAETSVEAHKRVNKTKDRELVYGYIYHAGKYGHTLDELSVMLYRTPNAISGRITELLKVGRIVISDQTRPTRTGARARVYLAS